MAPVPTSGLSWAELQPFLKLLLLNAISQPPLETALGCGSATTDDSPSGWVRSKEA